MPKYKEIVIKATISQDALLGAQPPREPTQLKNPIAAIIDALNFRPQCHPGWRPEEQKPEAKKGVKPDG